MTSHSPVAVRTARPDDLLAVLGVHVQQGNRLPGVVSEREQETWRYMMAAPNLTFYLAEIDGEVIGTATAMMMPNVTYDCAPTAFVEAVVVVARHRRQGIAREMLQRVLADARAAGCNKVQLLSHKRHALDGAHRLYTGLGFEPEAEGFRLYLQEAPVIVRAAKDP
ncbi:MAG: GNAT family N-acetyltransferase [Actinomycetota bacterium]|nr:GNAT family N-acetyltransferase [Actinomycetota bacterium]